MSCPEEYDLFLLREGADELSEERQQEVADHVASCADCQGKLAELEALGAALARPDALPENEKAAFLADVIGRVEAHEQQQAPATVASKLWRVYVPLAAAACCGLVALVVLPTFMLVSGDEAAPMVAMERAPSAQPASPSQEGLRALGYLGGEDQAEADEEASGEGRVASIRSKGRRHRGESGSFQTASAAPGMPAPAPPAPEATAATKSSNNRYGIKGPSSGAMGNVLARGGAADSAARPAEIGGVLTPPARRPAPTHGWSEPTKTGSTANTPLMRAQATPSAIDPNGRFATTYRPGRGHLARFERAMHSGRLPEPALALVADEGRGSGPEVAAPTEQALALDIRTGMRQLAPEGGPVHVALTLRSTAQPPVGRPNVAVHLVMDTSGSMSGDAIEHARQAARQLVSLLEPQDRFSLVSYSTDSQIVVTEGPVGPRRAQITGQIGQLRAMGGTNLEAGLRAGYALAQQSRTSQQESVQLVVVLSDGRPNQGITNPVTLSEMSAAAFQGGVETTTIGVGDNYEPQVMSNIAEYGAGGYYYLPDSSTIEQVLRAELDVRCHPVARGVELRVRLADGVELLQAYGSRRLTAAEAARVRRSEVAIDHQAAHRDNIRTDREQDNEGGMRFFIPGFARDDQHTILLRLRAPARSGSSADALLADVELRYKDRVLRSNQGDERQVRAPYATDLRTALGTLRPEVRRTVLTFRTGEALTEVSQRMARGDSSSALAILFERVRLLRAAAEELNDPALRADAERLDSFRGVIAARSFDNQLMLGSMLQRAGSGMMH